MSSVTMMMSFVFNCSDKEFRIFASSPWQGQHRLMGIVTFRAI